MLIALYVAAMIANSQTYGNSLGQTAALVLESHGLLIQCATVKFIYDRVEYTIVREGTHGLDPIVKSSSCDRLIQHVGRQKIVLYHQKRT
jgi:hypothetical protein